MTSYRYSSDLTVLLVLDGMAHGAMADNTLTVNNWSWEGTKHAEDKQQDQEGRAEKLCWCENLC